jgi:hypothetical protein
MAGAKARFGPAPAPDRRDANPAIRVGRPVRTPDRGRATGSQGIQNSARGLHGAARTAPLPRRVPRISPKVARLRGPGRGLARRMQYR